MHADNLAARALAIADRNSSPSTAPGINSPPMISAGVPSMPIERASFRLASIRAWIAGSSMSRCNRGQSSPMCCAASWIIALVVCGGAAMIASRSFS
jgi:hypothetical protein